MRLNNKWLIMNDQDCVPWSQFVNIACYEIYKNKKCGVL